MSFALFLKFVVLWCLLIAMKELLITATVYGFTILICWSYKNSEKYGYGFFMGAIFGAVGMLLEVAVILIETKDTNYLWIVKSSTFCFILITLYIQRRCWKEKPDEVKQLKAKIEDIQSNMEGLAQSNIKAVDVLTTISEQLESLRRLIPATSTPASSSNDNDTLNSQCEISPIAPNLDTSATNPISPNVRDLTAMFEKKSQDSKVSSSSSLNGSSLSSPNDPSVSKGPVPTDAEDSVATEPDDDDGNSAALCITSDGRVSESRESDSR